MERLKEKLSPAFFIAWRFFTESKRSMILSSLGVVFGVAFFIVGQAQTEGFQRYFISNVLGSKGAVSITDRFKSSYTQLLEEKDTDVKIVNTTQSRKYYPGIYESPRMIRTLDDFPNVQACSPLLQGSASLRVGFRSDIVSVYGIDLDYHVKATDFKKQLIEGTVEEFRANPDSIAISSEIANKMEIKRGQNVFLIGPDGEARRFKFNAIYETGINSIDQRRVYVHRRAAQGVLKVPYPTSEIIVKLYEPQSAVQDAKAFERLLSHLSRPWQESEKSNLQIFYTLRISAGIAVSCIILLAGFGIFNVLTMSVLEKTREIAILRSMGYTRADIGAIFLWQGLCIAGLGIVFGWIAGALLTALVSHIPIKVRGIFKADHFIVEWSLSHYILAAVLALLSVLIAAYIPARRAASVDPVNILRGTSG